MKDANSTSHLLDLVKSQLNVYVILSIKFIELNSLI